MDKFPVFGSLKNSFQFIFENWRHALEVMWPYGLILISVTGIARYFIDAEDAFWIAIWPLIILAYVLVGVAWQRFYLQDPISTQQPHRHLITYQYWLHTFVYGVFSILFIMSSFFLFAFPAMSHIYLERFDYVVGLGFYEILEIAITVFAFYILIPAGIPFVFVLLCSRFFPYLSSLVTSKPISINDSFRLSKGGAIRLSCIFTITTMLYSLLLTTLIYIAGLWNFDEDLETLQTFYSQDLSDMHPFLRESMLETQAFTSTVSWIDFFLLGPLPIMLSLFFSLVVTTNIAQFYKWAISK